MRVTKEQGNKNRIKIIISNSWSKLTVRHEVVSVKQLQPSIDFEFTD